MELLTGFFATLWPQLNVFLNVVILFLHTMGDIVLAKFMHKFA